MNTLIHVYCGFMGTVVLTLEKLEAEDLLTLLSENKTPRLGSFKFSYSIESQNWHYPLFYCVKTCIKPVIGKILCSKLY